jgi:hypothetical protein
MLMLILVNFNFKRILSILTNIDNAHHILNELKLQNL